MERTIFAEDAAPLARKALDKNRSIFTDISETHEVQSNDSSTCL